MTSKPCTSDKILNPATGRCVARDGKIGKMILSTIVESAAGSATGGGMGVARRSSPPPLDPCPTGKILNPATGKCVSRDGKIGMKLGKQRADVAAASPARTSPIKKSSPRRVVQDDPCPTGKIMNPATGKCVSRDGKIGKHLAAAASSGRVGKRSPKKQGEFSGAYDTPTLLDAIKTGADIDVIRDLIQQDTASFQKKSSTVVLLMEAASRFRADVIEVLRENGVDIHAQQDKAFTLAAATMEKSGDRSGAKLQTLHYFLEHGADANADNGKALENVVRYGEKDAVALLLARGGTMTDAITDMYMLVFAQDVYNDVYKEQIDFIRRLDNATKKIIKLYTRSGMSKDMNEKLCMDKYKNVSDLPTETKQVYDALMSVYDRVPPLQRPTTVWRGIGGDKKKKKKAREQGDFNEQRLVCQFISTSISKSFANMFTSGSCCLLKITLPAGSKVIPMDEVSHYGGEMEILLPPNGTWIVVRKYIQPYEGLPTTFYDLTYIPSNSELV
jgi:hypothetical protein